MNIHVIRYILLWRPVADELDNARGHRVLNCSRNPLAVNPRLARLEVLMIFFFFFWNKHNIYRRVWIAMAAALVPVLLGGFEGPVHHFTSSPVRSDQPTSSQPLLVMVVPVDKRLLMTAILMLLPLMTTVIVRLLRKRASLQHLERHMPQLFVDCLHFVPPCTK